MTTKLTSVKISIDLQKKFKVECIEGDMNMQKLVKLMETLGPNSKEAVSQLKIMHSNKYFKNDKQIESQVALCKKMKWW